MKELQNSVAGSGAFYPGSGMGKKSRFGSGMNITNNTSERLRKI
jgi:hypothetical protein